MNFYRNYFVIVKLLGLLAFLAGSVMGEDENLHQKCIHFLIMALFFFGTVLLELDGESKRKTAFWIGEGIPACIGVFLFPVTGILFLTLWILDGISCFWGKLSGYFLTYGILALVYRLGMDLRIWFLLLTFLILFYIQEKVILKFYRRIIQENEETEGMLKTTMERSDRKFKKELQKSHLHFENQMLEEKGRISQALHDKLGHSINGSVYKLEAAKLLTDAKPQESQQILQEVIDNLRQSMDEIRMILRKERPDKKRMALLSLQSLCEECQEKYNIHAVLNIARESDKIPENIWEIILDNTFEAVTNSLKYSECRNLSIDILPMNEVVRCTIRDDGKGAAEVKEGMGMEGMKMRVRGVKGFFDVETDVGIGFTINMILPLKGQQPGEKAQKN